MQKTLKLDLDDLEPQEAPLVLSTMERPLTLRPYTLRVQLWAKKRFGEDALNVAMKTSDVETLAQLAFFMLKDEDKALYKDFDAFTDSVKSIKDQKALVEALMLTIGLSQPMLAKLTAQLEEKPAGNVPIPSEPSTGESSSI